MLYHYAEGWVVYYHRFSMSVYEAIQRKLVSFYYNSPSLKSPEGVSHYLEIHDWIDKNIKEDWFYDVHNDNTVWFGFTSKTDAELFRLVWG